MKVSLSWLKEYVDISMSIEDLAHRLTLAGLEVEEIRYVGLPMPQGQQEFKYSGFSWQPDKIVVAAIHEVMPHPNADRLVLCRLDDGEQVHTVLTGAPNLFQYREQGPLDPPLKVVYAREGATIINAYEPGYQPTTLQRKKIRGVESYSMACSERELGISDEHEGIILLDPDAPTGMPLVEYMGDAIFDIAITPNIARDANVLGIAREISALTGTTLRQPDLEVEMRGQPLAGRVEIEIKDPDLNPRFVFGMIEGVTLQPSPYKVRLRLKLCGIRPIDALVDATNYAMLELGEPLHAFDYDILLRRAQAAGQQAPKVITRSAEQGETLVTLDGVKRKLNDFTVLVTDQSGPLALAGVMGGLESEVTASTNRVLLEGAAWNMINTRRTAMSQNLPSEASYRFSRGVHPELAPKGVLRGLKLMQAWAGGEIAQGLVDAYPQPPEDPVVAVTGQDVRRWLGIELSLAEIADLLAGLEFEVQVESERVIAKTPNHRLDIGSGVVGKADLMEEIARVYGYDRIPETRLSDTLPPQRGNRYLEIEERIRDLLVNLGLQEVISHRMTTPEREARRFSPTTAPSEMPYYQIANPISSDRTVLRQSLLSSILEVVERNARISPRLALFEIGPVFLASEQGELPDEVQTLVLALSGPRSLVSWQPGDQGAMDFFDLKGVVSGLLHGLHLNAGQYEAIEHPSFHPGKCARLWAAGKPLATLGELHPQVRAHFELPEAPLLLAEFNLQVLVDAVPRLFQVTSIPNQPPVLEDIAVIVDEQVPAVQVEDLIRQTGGNLVTAVQLFDVYRGAQIGAGKKSLAYSLTYQAADRTLTDQEVAKTRNKIIRRLTQELNAELRG